MTPDERIVWVKAGLGRSVHQIIENAPCGLSVTTQYFQDDDKVRQDIAMIVDQVESASGAVGAVG